MILTHLITSLTFATSIVLIYHTGETSALRCYHCNSHQKNSSCGDPFDKELNEPIDCGSLNADKNYTYCRKTIDTISQPTKSDMRISRTCGYLEDAKFKEDEPCYRKSGGSSGGVSNIYCACYQDECNSADWRSAGTGWMLVLGCAALIISSSYNNANHR